MSTPKTNNRRKANKHNSIPDQRVSFSTVASVASRPRNFIAPKLVVKLRYHERVPASLTAGIVNDYQFRLNSPFDPDFTGGGHQPYGWDQLTAIYNSATPCETSVVCNNSQTPLTAAYDLAAESSNCYGTKQHNVYNPATIGGSINLAFLNGETESQYAANENTSAAYNANPAEVLNLHVVQINSAACIVYISMTLDFVVELFDQFQLSQS